MLTNAVTRILTFPITNQISMSRRLGMAFTDDDQGASLFLDFVRHLYGVQTVAEANSVSELPIQ